MSYGGAMNLGTMLPHTTWLWRCQTGSKQDTVAKVCIHNRSRLCTHRSYEPWDDAPPYDMALAVSNWQHSEALTVHDGRPTLVVLALGDPHLLESRQRRQDRSSDPHGVLPLRRSHHLDLHGGRGQSSQLLGHPLADASEHRGATAQHDIRIEVLTDVDIALHDALESGVMDTAGLLADEAWLEEHLWATEALAAHRDDVAVGQLVSLLLVRALSGGLHLSVVIECDVRQLLLHISHDLTLGGGGERIATLGQDLHHVLRQVTACQVQAQNRMGQCIALVDRHGVRHTVARVHHDAGGTARGIQGQHSLDGNIHGRHIEGLEHDLRHALTIGLRIQRGLREEDRVLLRCHTELVVERVMPDLLHVVPVRHNAVLDRVLQGEDTSLALCLITDVRVLLVHADHDARHLRAANNRWEHSAGRIVASEASLAHAAAIVDDERRDLVLVSHVWKCVSVDSVKL